MTENATKKEPLRTGIFRMTGKDCMDAAEADLKGAFEDITEAVSHFGDMKEDKNFKLTDQDSWRIGETLKVIEQLVELLKAEL